MPITNTPALQNDPYNLLNRTPAKPIGKMPRSLFRIMKPDPLISATYLTTLTKHINREASPGMQADIKGMNAIRYRGHICYYVGYSWTPKNSETFKQGRESKRDTIHKARVLHLTMRSMVSSVKNPLATLATGLSPQNTKKALSNAIFNANDELRRLQDVRYAVFTINPASPSNYADELVILATNIRRDLIKAYVQDSWNRSVQSKKHFARAKSRQALVKTKRSNYGSYTLVGGVHTEPGTFVRLHMEKMRNILKHTKTPMNNERHIGVELEASIPRGRWDELKELLVKTGFGNYMCLGTDGSVTASDYYTGGELRLCAPTQTIGDVVRAACKALNKVRAKVDRSCGLHVHLDAREVLDVDARGMFRKLVRQSLPLYLTQPASRRGNRFTMWSEVEDWGAGNGRYKSVNSEAFHKYQTIEVRLHAGTIQAHKINHWIELIEAIAYGKALKNNFKTVESLTHALVLQNRITAKCAEYFDARAIQFKDAPAPVMSQRSEDYREFVDNLALNTSQDLPEELYSVDGGSTEWDEEQMAV